MIEVLKQWAEDVSKAYDVLAFGHTERALEILANTRTSLRQSIADLESQEPVAWMYDDDYQRMLTSETFCKVWSVEVDSATRGVTTVPLYTHPPQEQNCQEEHMRDLVYRLQKRAEIRRQISVRKSVQEGKPDRIADLLDEAADALLKKKNT